MFAASTIITAIIFSMALLVGAAFYTEQKLDRGQDLTNNGLVYALSIGIFYSAWTYYGSVGLAARSGFLFFTFYIGATLAATLWWIYLRKLVRIKNTLRLTSIADFVAARYGKSQLIAAIITLTIIVGIAPYIALQLKAIRTTYTIIAAPLTSFQQIGNDVTPLVVIFVITFTLIFGVRHVDPTKRHAGMVMAVALESLIQLLFFLVAGIFIVFFVFNGFGDIFQQLKTSGLDIKMPLRQTASPFLTWVTFIVLAMSAVLFLPRQFHIGVIELSNEKNIRSAIWIFPLYTFLTTLFMFPIAMAGILKGLPLEEADSYVLAVPAMYGNPWISLLIFIGGFAAATSMIMISSMTLGTMMANHLVLPLLGEFKCLRFLRRHLLAIKRLAVAAVVVLGYVADIMLGNSHALVSIGIMSFVVAAQFGPAILGGIFWRRANKAGAVLGLCSGILIWFYTILMPAFARSGWVSMALLEDGPWGIELLKPENLLGVVGLHPIVHGTMWSLLVNTLLYILGSLYFIQGQEERRLADSFVDILLPRRLQDSSSFTAHKCVDLTEKIQIFQKRLGLFFKKPQVAEMVDAGIDKAGIKGEKQITVLELAEMVSEIQKQLGGAIGSAAARNVLNDAVIYSPDEFGALKEVYTNILLELKVSPDELIQKIDYYQEKEKLLTGHAEELREKVLELREEITERKRVEAALQKNEKQLQIILESNPDPVVVYDSEGRTLFVNPAFTRVFGWEFSEVENRTIPFIPENLEDDSKKWVQTPLDKDGPISFETKRLTKSGKILDVVVSAASTMEAGDKRGRMIINLRDITDKLRMKGQVQQTQKMQALGTLAGGIAHDFNNILAAIMGFTELAMMSVDDEKLLRENLEDVLLSGQRAKELVQQILTFSRQSKQEQKPIRVKPYVKEALNLMRSSLPTTIEIRQDLQSDALISGDAIQIHQVVMNLCTNASHSMGKDGGVLEVKLHDVELDSDFASLQADLSPGPYIKLSVGDNGCGMPVEVLNRIFEPFFTTKGESEGTGMGLSMVHGIIKSHGGEILVRSDPGIGTTVDIFLPIIEISDTQQKGIQTEVPKGTERILFVDDEVVITRMGRQLLEGLGYEVTVRTSSVEAFELFRAKPDYFDLVITDMTMPNLTGDQLTRKINAIRPEMPIILCTGFSANMDRYKAELLGANSFLLKPISKNELARHVRNALDQMQN